MTDQEALNREADRLYEQFGKPLEAEHWGEFVAITPNGRTVIASTPVEAFMKASKAFGSGNYIFQIGERIVATLRSPINRWSESTDLRGTERNPR